MAGFEFSKKQGSTGTEGNIQTYAVNAAHTTLLAPGDPVVVTGDATADGIAEVDTGNAATANTGIIISVDYQLAGENLTETGLPALTAGTVKVNIDPLSLFEVEVADATLTLGAVGLNIDAKIVTATKTGGLTVSNMAVDGIQSSTVITKPYRIERILKGKTSGVLGDRVLVSPNATTWSTGAVGLL